MIGILSNKLSKKFLNGLGLEYELIEKFNPNIIKDFDGLFIDWVSKMSDNEVAWMKQASLLQTYIKSDIPIVIFDRAMSLTEKEVNWCRKFNVCLFEPYLNSGRKYFTYLPEWVDDTEILIKDTDARIFDVVYYTNNIERQLKGFEKWIQNYSRIFHDRKVAYSSMFLSDFKKEEFTNDNLIFQNLDCHIYDVGNITVGFDTDKAYKTGYLNPMFFNAMNLGCLSLLPIEHKYFHGLFHGLVIKNLSDMDYYVSTMSKLKDVLIEEIFDRIKTEWQEFTIKHAMDVIKRSYE